MIVCTVPYYRACLTVAFPFDYHWTVGSASLVPLSCMPTCQVANQQVVGVGLHGHFGKECTECSGWNNNA